MKKPKGMGEPESPLSSRLSSDESPLYGSQNVELRYYSMTVSFIDLNGRQHIYRNIAEGAAYVLAKQLQDMGYSVEVTA
jgi:hypothetical protein